jgi:phosphatidylserine/phosphatidylglycerophosphate/cardiolipin synthase-like enzyme
VRRRGVNPGLQLVGLGAVALLALLGYWASRPATQQRATIASSTNGPLEVYFSPNGGCTAAIVRELDAATRTIRVQAYSFTSRPIAQALLAAEQRGVTIEVLLDSSNRSDRYSAATFLKNHGIAVLIDGQHAIAHNKIILIDDAVIITGSFNFSRAAEESNAENLLVIRDQPELMARYQANFAAHAAHSAPY